MPDNHFTRRREDHPSQGYTPEPAPAAPGVFLLILCWSVIVCLFTLLGLPFVQWLLDHGSQP